MGKRRRARELALQYLYQWDFHGAAAGAGEDPVWEDQGDPEVQAHARAIVNGVREKKDEIDQVIVTQSQHWKLYRMTRIDRNILRISVYELLACPEIPPKVSIDEAIEIAKKFGTSQSSAFINGLLDQIGKRCGKIADPAASGQDQKHETSGDGNTD